MSRVFLPSGLALSYARQGGALDPTVVLLPGPTDSWRSYEKVLDRLPADISAIALSQRGHGDSDKPATGYDTHHFATDILMLLDALDVRRAVLVGHSGSCLVARKVALDHPDRVAGLLLEASPTSLHNHPQLMRFVESVVSELEEPISPDFARAFLAQTSTNEIDHVFFDLLVHELLKVPRHVWQEMFRNLLDYDDLTEVRRIQAPTLLVWGDADTIVTREMQEHLLNSIRTAELLVYHGVGHTPRWEDPARFSSDLATFTRQLVRTRS